MEDLQLDPESSLYFLRARYYDPKVGRFISRDPVSGVLTNPQTQNPYVYALNNPVNNSDPSGEAVPIAIYLYLSALGVAPDTNLDMMLLSQDWSNCDWGSVALDLAGLALPGISVGAIKVVSKGLGNISGGKATINQILKSAQDWLGSGYKEIAPGVYRSADNTRQFRMTEGDLNDIRQGSHVHFESIDPITGKVIENSHVKVEP